LLQNGGYHGYNLSKHDAAGEFGQKVGTNGGISQQSEVAPHLSAFIVQTLVLQKLKPSNVLNFVLSDEIRVVELLVP